MATGGATSSGAAHSTAKAAPNKKAAVKTHSINLEEKYDYTSKAKGMSLQDFKELMQTNVAVNQALEPFTGKLEAV